MYRIPTQTWESPRQPGNWGLYAILNLGERGRGLELQREGRKFIGIREEQIFGKQRFVNIFRDNRIQRELGTNRPCWAPLSLLHLTHLWSFLVVVLFLGQAPYINSFRQLKRGKILPTTFLIMKIRKVLVKS